MNLMDSAELYGHLRANLPPGYDCLEALESDAVSVSTGDSRWGHCLVTVDVEWGGDGYVVSEDGWATLGWLGAVEAPNLSVSTRTRIEEIAAAERIELEDLAFVVSGISREELGDAVVRMLRALHAVVDLDPMYARQTAFAAD